ncbi:MAG TPA: hypothetical protein VJ837_04540 [Candidatus Paceibacterota bacterium]|nr:hypothetical protein [Candidatus Paceibacterota bacterium]
MYMTPEEQQLTDLVRSVRAGSGKFKPFAVFDEQLDCIRVVWRDCSANEIRVSKLITILEDNYPESGKPECVGVTIKGVAHICETSGISPDAPWKLADLLDAVAKMDKPVGRYTLERDVRPNVEEYHLDEVEVPA